MIRYLKILLLRFRAGMLEHQIEHAFDLIEDHKVRLKNCQTELRRIKIDISMRTPASTLLEQALRRKI